MIRIEQTTAYRNTDRIVPFDTITKLQSTAKTSRLKKGSYCENKVFKKRSGIVCRNYLDVAMTLWVS